MEKGDILDETITVDVIKEFEKIYRRSLQTDSVSRNIEFKYATCLVRSPYATDIHKGISLFLNLLDVDEEVEFTTVDCAYHVALGKARLQEYDVAQRYIKVIRDVEPDNPLFILLETEIKKRQRKEMINKIKVGSSIVMTVGGIVGLGITLGKLL